MAEKDASIDHLVFKVRREVDEEKLKDKKYKGLEYDDYLDTLTPKQLKAECIQWYISAHSRMADRAEAAILLKMVLELVDDK
jgi:hypothetical protein